MNRERVKELSIKAMDLRKVVLEMIRKSGGGHIGGDFSVMETLVALYFDVMNISPENKDDPDRDYFVMSKGHSVESYYAVLADKGFFDTQELIDTFSQFGSKFIGHPNNEVDGVEMNSGSLGHGLPVAVGMALACRMDKRPSRIYTVMGDGELAEGSVWEGFMAAGHYKLGNLCAVVDRNHLQISGTTEEVMTHENLHQQVESFGWNVLEANGNSISEMSEAFQSAMNVDDKPTLIIANTIKGFGGGDVMENNVGWHHHVPNDEEYEKIVKAIDERKEELENE
ncbi:transketolase [Butyrivibrio sp.]|uniref:transketolase n=1 Tax=Butyrivibrio sp. TaxID=28121 RepID=UPI0025C13F07|nr:transketolase [Butyrivibrio sp.]MBE5838174.1 transketolase [Butyrivibrio sp.]